MKTQTLNATVRLAIIVAIASTIGPATTRAAGQPQEPEPVVPREQADPAGRGDGRERPMAPMQDMPAMQRGHQMPMMQMSCCPPSAMSKMVDKPGGAAMMLVCGVLAAALLASIIAVLIALTVFLLRRSRPPAVTR